MVAMVVRHRRWEKYRLPGGKKRKYSTDLGAILVLLRNLLAFFVFLGKRHPFRPSPAWPLRQQVEKGPKEARNKGAVQCYYIEWH